MENEKVEDKKAADGEFFANLRNFATLSASEYFNAESDDAKDAVLGEFTNGLVAEYGFTQEHAKALADTFVEMGNEAGKKKREVMKAINEALKEYGAVEYDKTAYNEADPEKKVIWRFSDTMRDRGALFMYNIHRSSNGLGSALDRIILGAKSGSLRARFASRRFARAASEALRGAKNGFLAGCSSLRTKAGLMFERYFQNRAMKHNVRLDHTKAEVTPKYEQATIARLDAALASEINSKEIANLKQLKQYLEVSANPQTAVDKDNADKFDTKNQTLRFINMYMDGYPEAQDVYSSYVKFATSPRELTKAEQRRADYAEKKAERQNDFEEDVVSRFTTAANELNGLKIGAKVYHAEKARVNSERLEERNKAVAQKRAELHNTDENNEYKRVTNRTVAVNGSKLSRVANFILGPNGTQVAAPAEAEKENEVQPAADTEAPKKEGWRARRAREKAEKKQARTEKEDGKENNETSEANEMNQDEQKPSKEEKKGFWAGLFGRKDKTAKDEKAPEVTNETAEKSADTKSTETKPVTKVKGVRNRIANWRIARLDKKVKQATESGNAERVELLNGKIEKIAGKTEARNKKNERIHDAKVKRNKANGTAGQGCRDEIREAKDEYNKSIAALNNAYNTLRNKVKSSKKSNDKVADEKQEVVAEAKEAPAEKQQKKDSWFRRAGRRIRGWFKRNKKDNTINDGKDHTFNAVVNGEPTTDEKPATEGEAKGAAADASATATAGDAAKADADEKPAEEGEAKEDDKKVDDKDADKQSEAAATASADVKPEEPKVEDADKAEVLPPVGSSEISTDELADESYVKAMEECVKAHKEAKAAQQAADEAMALYEELRAKAEKCAEERRAAKAKINARKVAAQQAEATQVKEAEAQVKEEAATR